MRPLPDWACRGPITTAAAREAGVGRRELEGPLWRAPSHGVRCWSALDADDPLQRIHVVAAGLPPGAVIGGWAAAFLHGATALDGRVPSGSGAEPVLVVRASPDERLRREGVATLRSRLVDGDTSEVGGIPVTSRLRTASDLARTSGLTEAVVALDALAGPAGADLEALRAYVDERGRWRGVPGARRALALADPRAESVGESRLRVLWVVDAGLPRPYVNATVLDEHGRILAEADLLDPAAGLVGEYDGALHRESRQHAEDNAREEWLEHTNLRVTRFGSVDLGPRRARSVSRLRAAHALGTGRDRSRDRWLWRER